MNGLMLHCGGFETTLKAVREVPLPEVTETFRPIPHDMLYQMVNAELKRRDLKVVNRVHALASEGNHYFGLMQLEGLGDYTTVIGLRNSHDKRFPAGMVVGSSVFVCDNLCFSGEVQFFRRHTKGIVIDLEENVPERLEKVLVLRRDMDKRIRAYKEYEMTTPEADHLIMEFARRGIITSTQVMKVAEEFRTPRHDEFLAHGHTGWTLMNAVTEYQKARGLPQHKRHIEMHSMLDAAVGGVTLEGEYQEAA